MFDPTNVPAESTGSAQVLSAFRAGVTSPEQLRQVEQAGKEALTSVYKSLPNVQQLLQQSQPLNQVSGRALSPTPEKLGYRPNTREEVNSPPQKKSLVDRIRESRPYQLGGRVVGGVRGAWNRIRKSRPYQLGGRVVGGVRGAWNVAETVSATLTGPMRQGAGMVNTINNASLSDSQRDKRLVDSIPVIGELVSSFRDLRDAIDGTTERIRQEGVDQENRLMREQNRAAREQELESRRRELTSARNVAGVMAGVAPSAYTAPDRSTGSGAIDYNISRQRLSSTDALASSRRRAEMSARDVISARGRIGPLGTQIRQAESDRTAAARDVRTIRSRPGYDATSSRDRADEEAALNRVGLANQRILNLNAQRRVASDNLAQAEIRNANDISAVRQRGIDQLRTEIQILQQREQSMSSSAQRFGMTTEFEQDTAIQFAEIARTEGIGALLPEQRQLVQQMFPQFASGELEREGEQSRGYRYARDVLGEFGSEARGQSLADTRGSVDRLQAEVRNNIIIDERELANQIAASLGPAMERLIETINSEARARTSEMVRHRLMGISTGGS